MTLRRYLIVALALFAVSCTAPISPTADVLPDEATAVETTLEVTQTADVSSADTAVADAPPIDSDAVAESTSDAAPPDIADAAIGDGATVDAATTDANAAEVDADTANAAPVCPIAVVTIVGGNVAVPQTVLHLKGSKSYSPIGLAIKKYKWTAKQPAGSNQPILPNASFANPTFLANVSGEYEFCLDVWDANDIKSCVPTCEKVLAMPGNGVHIELLWDTPNDADQGDAGPKSGADLDLHFAHPMASTLDLDCDGTADPWFDNPWDSFWFNAAPPWGDLNNKLDDPSLDLDDTDGAGPENLNLKAPEGTVNEPVAYAVGVHYWNDHDYGVSFATVALYLQGGLALQFTKVKLDPLDMWYIGRLNWPNTASGGNKKVFDTCYQSGASCPANQSLMWQAKGDWCITKCYQNKVFADQIGGMKPKPAWCP